MNLVEVENILQTYSFNEILEFNDLSEEDTLLFLIEEEFVVLPNPTPI